jgi:hypothetical protein
MEKIIILGDPWKKYNVLVASLRRLFPDCEIEVHLKREVNRYSAQFSQSHADRKRKVKDA